MKLIDCFMYFDEDLILEIRLNTLNEVVDKDEHHDGPCEDHCGGIPGGDLLVSEFNGTFK